MSEKKDTRVEEGRNAHGTTCQAGGMVALPEQKAFFPPGACE
ncbi:MAG: hypothetical protein ABIJ53_01820 [Verrucomicrobiota bacterium]